MWLGCVSKTYCPICNICVQIQYIANLTGIYVPWILILTNFAVWIAEISKVTQKSGSYPQVTTVLIFFWFFIMFILLEIFCSFAVESLFFIKWLWNICMCVTWQSVCTTGDNLTIALENVDSFKVIHMTSANCVIMNYMSRCNLNVPSFEPTNWDLASCNAVCPYSLGILIMVL